MKRNQYAVLGPIIWVLAVLCIVGIIGGILS
jgi:hypothetical protein